ncbi:RNA-directed DNA polymerase [Gracilibacillus sp. YIM 98692]|uniref:RNA-directed DNA polymerase n=1 Tax=Gracilibacillus sp. YIM 98692 TaxID=2663532 RepID=UPI0013D618B6|nr:RNA-directed DNA polymerase [Gracilibacillus sp. YIM 98692]
MKTVIEKYQSISPTIDYLNDQIVLAQAWKKSHTYIRGHNWYFDMLDLDSSAVNIKELLKEWSSEISNGYKTNPIKMVLAPKSQRWEFVGKDQWKPVVNEEHDKNKDNIQELRSLAHISIKDQTVSTAVMLCLANAVESAQGKPDENNFLKEQKNEMYSYGNRLQCNWLVHKNKKKQAQFSWGSSKCYRKYFEDYRYFLSRPKKVCDYYAPTLSSSEELFVVCLDLSKYFNSIEIPALIDELKHLYQEYVRDFDLSDNIQDNEEFWNKVEQIFDWDWSEEDKKQAQNDKITSLGLPQGLVASGFLANAYLIRFDRLVGEQIKEEETKKNIQILDYCRYVDDLRLVIKVSGKKRVEDIEDEVSAVIQNFLEKHLTKINAKTKQIEINEEKTKVIPYRQLSTNSSITSNMEAIQHRISGTPDKEELQQVITELTGLLRLADTLEETSDGKKSNDLDLSRIALPETDIRDDTMKRFSATRLVKTLQSRKSLLVHDKKVVEDKIAETSITAEEFLDQEFESGARRLIAAWSKDPSLILLLQNGFELYPDQKLLGPVLEALRSKLESPSYDQRKTAEFVLSYLLRSAAIYIGFKSRDNYPKSVDISTFRSELGSFAKNLMNNYRDLPWYVKQQSILYLLTNKDYGFTISNDKELKSYRLLYDAALYHTYNNKVTERLTASFIAQQLNANREKYTTWFIDMLDQVKDKTQQKLIDLIRMNRPDLFQQILRMNRVKHKKWYKFVPRALIDSLSCEVNMDHTLINNMKYSFVNIIKNKNNPFKQENALLLLATKLLDKDNINYLQDNRYKIENIKIECNDWKKVQNPTYKGLTVKWNKQMDGKNESFEIPSWIEEEYEWMYKLGAILRAAFVGEFDFTAHTYLYRGDMGIYKGIKSNSYTRSFSLINHGKGITGETMPITPWLSEFLYTLLQWPGINQWEKEIEDWHLVSKPEDLNDIIEKRISHQAKMYGEMSDLPTYSIPIRQYTLDERSKLRFAIVQPMLPQMKDFNMKDPTSWTEEYRKIQRDHLASMCHLIYKHVQATASARKVIEKGNDKDIDKLLGVDIIVFPELSIHPDDVFLLRRLSNITDAHIFAGLTFQHSTSFAKPVNQALWLLRDRDSAGTDIIEVKQGKYNMTKEEASMGIQSHRPYQLIVELQGKNKDPIRLSGSICYDATDLAIAADLKDITDVFVVAALNKDINTFDNMVAYLHYHMYQPVILANTGEFGGSSVQAPFRDHHQRTIAHVHGNQQIAISLFDIDPTIFKKESKPISHGELKTPPAGFNGR